MRAHTHCLYAKISRTARAANLDDRRSTSVGRIWFATAGKNGRISSNVSRENAFSFEPELLPLRPSKKFKSFVTFSAVSLSSCVTFGAKAMLFGNPRTGNKMGILASFKPTLVNTATADSLLKASTPLTTSSRRNSRKKLPCGDKTNCKASRDVFFSKFALASAETPEDVETSLLKLSRLRVNQSSGRRQIQ